jgi:hypothetical protein
MTLCRPYDDLKLEQEANDEWENEEEEDDGEEDDDEEDDDSDVGFNCDGGETCMCTKPLAEHPEWTWIVTRGGYEMMGALMTAAAYRDQDNFGQYHFNDFTGYGVQEVVENHLGAFNKEWNQATRRPLGLWQHVESFMLFVRHHTGVWFMIDDSHGVRETIKLIGVAVLSTLDVLDAQGLFTPDSEIKNLSLVLALSIEFAQSWPGDLGDVELSWAEEIVSRARKAGVVIQGPFGTEVKVKEMQDELGEETEDDEEDDEEDEEEDEEDNINWKKLNWQDEVSMKKVVIMSFG